MVLDYKIVSLQEGATRSFPPPQLVSVPLVTSFQGLLSRTKGWLPGYIFVSFPHLHRKENDTKR